MLSIVPIEKTQRAPTDHPKNMMKLMKKNTIGTNMTLKVDPTKSAAASRIAIDITRVLHMHNMVSK